MVAVADPFVDQHRGKAAGGTEIFKVFRDLGVAVEHFDAGSYFFTNAFYHFLVGHKAVGTQAEHDLHVLVGNPQFVHFVYQHRHKVKAVGYPGGIVANESHGLARFDDFIDGFRTDGIVDGVQHPLLYVFHNRGLRHADFFQDTAFIQGKAFGSTAIVECKFFHVAPPCVSVTILKIEAMVIDFASVLYICISALQH